jgi:futalosine hydrolase
MRLLIVAATEPEIEPLLAALLLTGEKDTRLNSYEYQRTKIDVLITGVGMVATAAWTSRVLTASKHDTVSGYDAAINAGICGSFDRTLALGDVVHVQTDCMPELGAEDDEQFIGIHDLKLLREEEFPYRNGRLQGHDAALFGRLLQLKRVSGITVNKVHGNERSIAEMTSRLNPQTESMEGAAFYYACAVAGVPALQVRAVSNYVEKRNRDAWKIGEAVKNLNAELLNYIKEQ